MPPKKWGSGKLKVGEDLDGEAVDDDDLDGEADDDDVDD